MKKHDTRSDQLPTAVQLATRTRFRLADGQMLPMSSIMDDHSMFIRARWQGEQSLKPLLPLARNAIFVSHQNKDIAEAKNISALIRSAGVQSYLDTEDPFIIGDGEYLEVYLREVIGASRALLAVVSDYTKESWWVPFEAGVARDRNKHLGTYLLTDEDLPSYLWLWPVLRSYYDVVRWAQATERAASDLIRQWRRHAFPLRMQFMAAQDAGGPFVSTRAMEESRRSFFRNL